MSNVNVGTSQKCAKSDSVMVIRHLSDVVDDNDDNNDKNNGDNGGGKNTAWYGVMVHRQYSNRVRDALLMRSSQWITVNKEGIGDDGNHLNNNDDNDGNYINRNNNDNDGEKECTVIETPHEKGVRKNRRGYNLLIVPNVQKSPAELPPIARQQISWCVKLTHILSLPPPNHHNNNNNDGSGDHRDNENGISGDDNESESQPISALLVKATQITYETLLQTFSFQHLSHYLRIDCYPPSLTLQACALLQKCASAATHDHHQTEVRKNQQDSINHPTDPFSGPIQMVRSITKANFVVTYVQIGPCEIAFGIDQKTNHWNRLNSLLNDRAAPDVCVLPVHPNTGIDLHQSHDEKHKRKQKHIQLNETKTQETSIDINVDIDTNISRVPVSRAYYKLKQILDEEFRTTNTIATMTNHSHSYLDQFAKCKGAGLDLGAAPGGWTQVLRDLANLPGGILSIDPGILAQRVLHPPTVVRHVRADFTSEQSVREMERLAPYSMVVCDASTDSHEVLDMILDALQNVHLRLSQDTPPTPTITDTITPTDTDIDTPTDTNTPTEINTPTDRRTNTNTPLLTLPAAMVITLKFPYKSANSLNRNLHKVLATLPAKLRRMYAWFQTRRNDDDHDNDDGDANVSIRFKILHLMANSVSERTALILFDTA